ncbi:MAG: 4-(cytidine 5'-diphospho)-2-C-methyl-D-erythritol kinase [Ponticaulis sp.]|nr:4-(cytidine 5'-diphospho)-2-C-methyl-D-erythritol kinase [Ponticaulis sp.]
MITIFAPAKINLYLHVGPVRNDGRHPLDSLVVFADQRAADRLIWSPSEDPLTFVVDGPQSEKPQNLSDPDNLVLRAARALEDETGRKFTGDLVLEKHLPIAAGIGGGSSDAAALLHLFNSAFDLNLSLEKLIDLARPLGGDVPACVAGRPVLMRGDGDRLESVSGIPEGFPALMVTPNVECPTAPVFRRFDEVSCPPSFEEVSPPEAETREDWLLELQEGYTNDLASAAISIVPEIEILLKRLGAFPDIRHFAMSGSGATCFGIFDSPEDVHKAARSLKSEFPDWCIFETAFGDAQFDLRKEDA